MKYVVFLPDGAADEPLAELSGKTPLEAAIHPNMDRLTRGIFGKARTVPVGMKPGSDNANLSVFGYDPLKYYTGRSPLEAASLGIPLDLSDVTYRCNTVTLSVADRLEDAVMLDYSAGEIDSSVSGELIAHMKPLIEQDEIELHNGISYRHCLVLRNAKDGCKLTPPHDITGKPVRDFLPAGQNSELLLSIMEKSYEELKKNAFGKANCLWFWGEGRKPALTPYREKFGVKGAVISAVDLIFGIGVCAGLDVIKVPGATGNYTTDFAATGQAAINAFKNGAEFVYIHVEAPDECGHHAQIREKVWSVEQIDEKIVGPVLSYLYSTGEPYKALLMPDHPTPIRIMTHSPEPVPFALYQSGDCGDEKRFCENEAEKTGVFVSEAHTLAEKMFKSR